MPIKVSCPSCGHAGKVPDKFAGKMVGCPACKKIIKVPLSAQEASNKTVRDIPPPPPTAIVPSPAHEVPEPVQEPVPSPVQIEPPAVRPKSPPAPAPQRVALPPIPPIPLGPPGPAAPQSINCPHCGSPVALASHLAGQTVGCPHCQGQLQMPGLPAPVPQQPVQAIQSTAPAEQPFTVSPPIPPAEVRPSDQAYVGWASYRAGQLPASQVQAARTLLGDGEILLAIVKGRAKTHASRKGGFFKISEHETDKGGSWVNHFLIVTDRRVILWARGVFKSSTESFDFSDITGVENQRGMLYGGVVLNVHGDRANFTEMHMEEAALVADIIRQQKQQQRTVQPAPPNVVRTPVVVTPTQGFAHATSKGGGLLLLLGIPFFLICLGCGGCTVVSILAPKPTKNAVALQPTDKGMEQAAPAPESPVEEGRKPATPDTQAQSTKEADEAQDAANRKAYDAEVARLKAEHQEQIEKYENDQAAYQQNMRAYDADKAEYEATRKLNSARQLFGSYSSKVAPKLKEIIKSYPDTQAAKDAQMLLDGKEVPVRNIPDVPVPPNQPKTKKPGKLILPPPPDRKSDAASETGPDDAEKVSAKELLESYAAGEGSADKKYKDKYVEIEAYVVRGTDNIETKRLVVSAEKGGPSILCLFDEKWTKELAKVQVGEKRRIRGQCKGKYPSTTIGVWLGNCSLPGAVPASSEEVGASNKQKKADHDALLSRLKSDKGPVFDCALVTIRKELPNRFGAENTKDAVIPNDHKALRLEKMDPRMLDDQGREDTWVVHGQLTSKGKDGRRYRMNWEVTVIANDGKLGGGSVRVEPLP